MDDFILYFQLGLKHVLDFQAYDHILFLTVLVVVYSFNEWKKVLWLVTLFTIGHTITLALSAFDVIRVNTAIVEFLIPLTIFVTAIVNVFTTGKSASANKLNLNLFFALFFGLIHGLGFSSYFKMLIGKSEAKFVPLIEFALGIEGAQIIIVLAFLVLGLLLQSIFRVSRRDWVLVISSIVIGFVIPMLVERNIW